VGGRFQTWAVVFVLGQSYSYVGALFPYAGGRFRAWARCFRTRAVICERGGRLRTLVAVGVGRRVVVHCLSVWLSWRSSPLSLSSLRHRVVVVCW
jgi:hypothetical protein